MSPFLYNIIKNFVCSQFPFWYLFLFLLFVGHAGMAQPRAYLVEQVSDSRVISDNVVYSVFQDDKGYLWFGTEAGLYRYDGHEYVGCESDVNDSLSLPQKTVFFSFENTKGEIWVAGSQYVSMLHRKDFTFSHYWSEEKSSQFSAHLFARDSDDNIWFASYEKMAKFNTVSKKWTFFSVKFSGGERFDNAMYFFIDNSQNIWLSIAGKLFLGVVTRDDSIDFSEFSIKSEVTIDFIKSIWQDEHNNYWLSTSSGLFYKKESSETFRRFPFNKMLSEFEEEVAAVNADNAGKIWIKTKEKIYVFESKSNSLEVISIAGFVLPERFWNSPRPVFHDTGGNHWVNANLKGLIRINEKQTYFHHLDDRLSQQGKVFSIFSDSQDGLWIGTNKGLNYHDPGMDIYKHFIHQKDNLGSIRGNDILSIGEDNTGNILVGTRWQGLNLYDKNTRRFRHFVESDKDTTALPVSSHYRAIYKDKKNRIWIVHLDGVSRMNEDGKTFKNYRLIKKVHGTGEEHLFSIVEDDEGMIWVGGSNQLFRIDPTNDSVANYPLENVKLSVLGIHYHKATNSIYIGSQFVGLIVFDVDKKTYITYNTADGLPSNEISCIMEDENKDLWISTGKGISKFKYRDKHFVNFDKTDGLAFDSFSSGAFFKKENGEMLFGGKSVVSFLPDSMQKVEDSFQSPLVITSIKVYGEDKTFKEETAVLKEITIPTTENYVELFFANLDFRHPDKREYEYKLDGYDKKWRKANRKHSANYTNLNVGEYTFRVKAANSYGQWNIRELTLKLIITPSFINEEPWFYPLLWTLVIGLLVFAVVWILKKRRQQEIEKNKKIREELEHEVLLASLQALRSQMNPHFLYNVLNSVNSFISKNEMDVANNFLVDFGRLMRNMLENSKQHIVSLEKELQFIWLYLEFEHLRFGNKFDFQINVDESINPAIVFLPTMLLQPFLENAVKHGLVHRKSKGLLQLNVILDNQNLIFTIKDDGVGRRKSAKIYRSYKSGIKSTGTGIKNIKERIEILKKLYKKNISLEIIDGHNGKEELSGTIVKMAIENPEIWNIT